MNRIPVTAFVGIFLFGTITAAQDFEEKIQQNFEKLQEIEKFDPSFVDPPVGVKPTSPQRISWFGGLRSVQVNLDTCGRNIIGDAANEPNIAVQPEWCNRIAIGYRHFEDLSHEKRLSGISRSFNAGWQWSAGDLTERFGSDPVLNVDNCGNFLYLSLRKSETNCNYCELNSSRDGVHWSLPVHAYGGDKAWMAIDRSWGPGRNNIYVATWANSCYPRHFSRSLDGGASFSPPTDLPHPYLAGTMSVDPSGTLYLGSLFFDTVFLQKSTDVHVQGSDPTFGLIPLNLGGELAWGPDINPAGPSSGAIGGQMYVETNHSRGPNRGNVYVLASVQPPGDDPLDVMFIRSEDGGLTWTDPKRINSDPQSPTSNQWFGTMSVAPCGRIDVIWNDSRDDPGGMISQLYYCASFDGGRTWMPNRPVSQPFNPRLNPPQRSLKMGDYNGMVSANCWAHITYTATFNGEQDVYYLHVPANIWCCPW